MKYLTIAALALLLASCGLAPEPPVVDDAPPPVVVTPDPAPAPDPGIAHAPVGTCPIEVTLTPLNEPGSIINPLIDARLQVELGSPCADGAFVPFVLREQNTVPGKLDEYDVLAEGVMFDGQGFSVAIPFERRRDRFELVDARDGSVVASVQNYRLRVPRPF